MTTTADSAAGVSADDEFPSPELLPHYEIQMDWQAYDRLPPDEQGKFVVIMKSLEQERWIGQREFSPLEWACIDLSEYANHDDFIAAIKKQGGAAFRQGRKAEERGFYSKFFDERTFIADIVDINCSAPERQGQPMRDSFLLTVDQRGGYPAQFYPPEIPPESTFWVQKFGTFRARPGHRQGSVVVDEQLVSYLSIRRFGDFACYNLILGHKDFLQDGVVNKLHLDFVKAIIEARNHVSSGLKPADVSLLGLRYIGYGSYLRIRPGLRHWKKSNNFQPGLFRFDFGPSAPRSAVVAEIDALQSALTETQAHNQALQDALEAEAARHSELQADIVSLRDRASRWNSVEDKLAAWRIKAGRYDRIMLPFNYVWKAIRRALGKRSNRPPSRHPPT